MIFDEGGLMIYLFFWFFGFLVFGFSTKKPNNFFLFTCFQFDLLCI